MLQYLNHISEFLCLLVSIYVYCRHKNFLITFFLCFLSIIFTIEIVAHFIVIGYNGFLYNILGIFILLCNCYLFLKIINNNNIKLFIISSSIAYCLLWLYENIICKNIHYTQVYLFEISCNLQMIFGLLFFLNQLLDKEYPKAYTNKFGIWYSIGIILFNAGVAISFSLIPYITLNKINLLGLPVYNTIPKLLSIVLYGCISIALLLWKPQKMK